MGKLTAIQTQSVFDGLWNQSKIDEHSVTFILDSGRIYTHGIYINGAVYGTEANGAINLTIAGSTKSLALSSHSHSNYYSKSENLDITSYIIKSGSVELLKYADSKIQLGGPIYVNGSIYSVRNNTTHTLLDTGNFSIESKTSSGTTMNNVTTFKYGNSTYQLDYVKRVTGTYTFDGINYTSAALISNSSKLYGLLTMYQDGTTTNAGYAQLRISVPDKTLEIRTSASTAWVSFLKGGSYVNWNINGVNKKVATTESSLPSLWAPTALGTSGQYLTTSDDAKSLVWRTLTIPTNALNTAGMVTAPTSSDGNKVWKTDADGKPGWRSDADNNTWRAIQVNGTQKLSTATNTGVLNIVNGTNTTVEWTNDNKLKINNTYSFSPATWAGATSSANGTAGYMPAPTSAQRTKFLRGDGSWVSLNNYSLPTATSSALGGVKIGTTLSDTTGYTKVHIDSNGFIYYKDLNTTYSTATSSTLGLVKIGDTITDTNGYTAVKIKDGVIYYKDTTYSHYNLIFKNREGNAIDTYKPTTSPTKTFQAGTNITMTAASNVITISATDTTYSAFKASGNNHAPGLVPDPGDTAGTTKYLREDGTWQTPPNTWNAFTAATASNAGKAGYIQAPKGAQGKFFRGDNTWQSITSNVTTSLYVGASNGTSTAAQSTNGNVYLILAEGSTYTRFNIVGTGRATVKSDANGKITIDSPAYSNFTAATASAAGASGLVPAPGKNVLGSSNYFLRADATWVKLGSHAFDSTAYVTADDLKVTTFEATMAVSKSWSDVTGWANNKIATGSYLVQVSYSTNRYFTGVMSWYAGTGGTADEIVLHYAGQNEPTRIYLQTVGGKIQIAADAAISSTKFTFKFRKLI